MSEKISLHDVTIVAVAGTKAKESIEAIKYSMRGIEFAAAKLITPEKISDPDVEIVQCENLNYEQYNHFIVYRLHKYIDTSHVLVVQNDGYVVNPDSWQNLFLDYDYIGAPWPLPQDSFSYRDPEGQIQRVGNGGFSLRSKRILEGAEKLDLEWKAFSGFYHEDGFFSCHHKKDYENLGCKYAPIEVAARFSHESYISEFDGILPFGFHGRNHFYYHHTQKIIRNTI